MIYDTSGGLRPHALIGRMESDKSRGKEASGSSDEPKIEQGSHKKRQISDGTIYIKGRQLGTITKVSTHMADGIILGNALRMCGVLNSLDEPEVTLVPNLLWRTLVAGRDSDGKEPPNWYRRACSELLLCIERISYLDIRACMILKEWPEMMIQFMRRVANVLHNRRFFHYKDEDSKTVLGLAPISAREEDVVCILFGCSVPVALRPSAQVDKSGCFEFIGECYIDGLMDGEAVSRINPRPQYPYDEAETFKIV